ncbi:MAG: IS701 family transposase [Actinobacteria bacterium]|nr:IS701 family transposase [Actinomycetota bacterium]
MFEPMQRKDQRRWGEVYLRGLMLDGRRKSIEPMAARLEDGDEQCLQQFVSQSPWEEAAVRRRLAARMSAEIAPEAWIVDDTGFPKFGDRSVGVAHQYCGALGKIANCQVGVSVNAADEEASCPLDWRLFMPREWDEDQERRAASHVPEGVRHVPKWRLALEMIDELRGWGLEAPAVLADAGYGDITGFRGGLEERELDYVVQVKGATSAFAEDIRPESPAYAGAGRPSKARYRARRSSLRELALEAGASAAVEVAWREGTRGELRSRFLPLRVRPANVGLRDRASREGAELSIAWLLCEWPEDAEEPVKYWLSNLPEDTPLERLIGLAKLRWRIEHDYRELKDALGLDHFEGRTHRGWNHHVTLVSVAHGFLTLERRRRPRARAAA